ncbi:hypothetical protein BD779DRAFT_1547217 [Infundibulicybe gibba]|nr:hypothetical protein BD779DRAFT_1547217 [Infundibulicybe gibba]
MMNLPPEIIQTIFLELCLPETISLLREDPRLLVTQVCSQWRAIAISMHTLWANIRIPTHLPLPHDQVRTWISRSAQSPLSVEFYGPFDYHTPPSDILEVIISAIWRCASLKLCVEELALERLLTLPSGTLRNLRHLSIKYTPSHRHRLILPRTTTFQQCPQLRRMTLAREGGGIDPAGFNLPWQQLTHLDMGSYLLYDYECLNILHQCTALQECSGFTLPSRDLQRVRAFSTRPLIVLPSLHTLRLALGDIEDHSIYFFRALRLPLLHSLRILRSLPHEMLPMFQHLLSETIRHLDLAWATADLPAALGLVPNLETLKLYDTRLKVLRALGGGTVVPRLITLELNDEVDSRDLFDMLEARAAAARADSGVTMFNHVSAIYSGHRGVDTARLAALRAAGVQLVLIKGYETPSSYRT